MIRKRSRLPLILVLALVTGLGLFRWHRDFMQESVRDPVGETSAKVPDGFGPIPTVAASDDGSRPLIQPGQVGAEAPTEAMQHLAARMSRDTGGLQVITHPDGRRSVNLAGRFMHMSAIVTGVDGKTQARCFSNYQEMVAAPPANSALSVPQPTPHVR